jgi:hypothetical protein
MDCKFSDEALAEGKWRHVCAECGFERINGASVSVVPIRRTCGQRAKSVAVAARGPCVHLGEEVRRDPCPTCSGHVRVKVFSCAVHGECQAAAKLAGVKACQGCGEWQALEALPAPSGDE